MKRASAQCRKLGLLQTACSPEPRSEPEKTLALANAPPGKARKSSAPRNLFRSQYFCQSEDHEFQTGRKNSRPSTDAFSKLAKKHRVVIIASLFEKRAAGVYHNTAAVIDADGSLLGIYRKMHIPDDPLYYEKFYFTPGDLGSRPGRRATGKSAC
jgi:N-carbamoylputrescine amidase